MSAATVRLLDGGMGRELQRIGAPFRQPEWSALALIEAPEFVLQAHRSFIAAGARIISTNSYANIISLFDEKFVEKGKIQLEGTFADKVYQINQHEPSEEFAKAYAKQAMEIYSLLKTYREEEVEA